MNVDAQHLSGWEGFQADRTARLDAAGDDALRKHFEAELEQARITIAAMGGDMPAGAQKVLEGPAPPLPDTQGALSEETAHGAAVPPQQAYIPDVPDAGLSGSLPPALQPYAQEIKAASEVTGVPANLLAAVIWDESKGIASASTVNGENGQSDSGLMQVNPETFASLKEAHPDLISGTPADPQSNIMAGALYLAENKQEFGSWDLALRAYNSGPLSVNPMDHTASTTGFGTKNYVEKVNFYADLLDGGKALPDGYPGGNQMY